VQGWDGGYEPTPLERIADAAGVDYWELRDWLEAEIEQRREQVAAGVGSTQSVPKRPDGGPLNQAVRPGETV
jgi:hypothetical protein